MKKVLSVILVIAMCLSFCSCGKKSPIEDEELVETLESAIRWESTAYFLFKDISITVPNILELEEISEGKYKASGEIFAAYQSGGNEHIPFTAVMSINSNDEVTFESFNIDAA